MEKEFERDMTPRLVGETYMRKATEKSRHRRRYGLYECQYCSKEFETITYKIKSGHTRSCGCQIGRGFKHGLESNKFYGVWYAMVKRCNNPKDKGYKNYGGRGITVCEDWLDIKNFVDWAEQTHPNIEGVSLDRIDNDKGYYPENCRWATREIQNTNQRVRSTNTSGYVGVGWAIRDKRWSATITVKGAQKHIGYFKTPEEAVKARDTYIIENNLPHKLNNNYKKETINGK